MGLIRFAAKMGTLFAGVGFVAGCGWIGEQLLKEALGSQDVSMGLGMGAGAVVLGLIVTPIAVALKQDDGIEDGRAVQLGLHNFSAHSASSASSSRGSCSRGSPRPGSSPPVLSLMPAEQSHVSFRSAFGSGFSLRSAASFWFASPAALSTPWRPAPQSEKISR